MNKTQNFQKFMRSFDIKLTNLISNAVGSGGSGTEIYWVIKRQKNFTKWAEREVFKLTHTGPPGPPAPPRPDSFREVA